jgi:hypothetical protein
MKHETGEDEEMAPGQHHGELLVAARQPAEARELTSTLTPTRWVQEGQDFSNCTQSFAVVRSAHVCIIALNENTHTGLFLEWAGRDGGESNSIWSVCDRTPAFVIPRIF